MQTDRHFVLKSAVNCTDTRCPEPLCCSCRYLLLEDPDTGDVLMPLIYMKAVLEANYSRKLASLKNRLVTGREGVSWLGWGSGRGGSD